MISSKIVIASLFIIFPVSAMQSPVEGNPCAYHEQEQKCTLCLGPLTNQEIKIELTCGHSYCLDCLYGWATSSNSGNTCPNPYCKKDMVIYDPLEYRRNGTIFVYAIGREEKPTDDQLKKLNSLRSYTDISVTSNSKVQIAGVPFQASAERPNHKPEVEELHLTQAEQREQEILLERAQNNQVVWDEQIAFNQREYDIAQQQQVFGNIDLDQQQAMLDQIEENNIAQQQVELDRFASANR